MGEAGSNYVNFGHEKKHRKKLGNKMKDRLVMISGGIVIFIFTFFLYGIVDEPGNDPAEKNVRTENLDILAQIDKLEEEKRSKEEKLGKIRNDVFLGKNAAVGEYTESLISDLKKRAEQQEEIKGILDGDETDTIDNGLQGAGSDEQLRDLLSYLEKEDEDPDVIFPEPDRINSHSAGRRTGRTGAKRVGTLFAFSNTQRSARIYNNGSGEVYYNLIDNTGQNRQDERRIRSGLSKNEQLIFNSNPVFTIFEGEFLYASLTNRIVNDKRSSPVSAVITKDLLDRTGDFVLIPANSKIIGSAQKVSGRQDKRLFISFHRLILPNGKSLEFGKGDKRMSAMDGSGALGIKGKKNNHFFARFGSSILYGSLNGLSGFAQNRISQTSGLSHFVGRTSDNFNTLNDRLASDSLAIIPTITVRAGTELKIRFAVDIKISAYSKVSERSYY